MDVVIDFVKKLLTPGNTLSKHPIKQTDIGVVAPYKLQCKILASICRQNNFNDVTVGTAEIFQGQERPVMIISTVRTDKMLGFVNDPQVKNNYYFSLLNLIQKSLSFDLLHAENECYHHQG